jgi:hypothetical protein
VPPSPPSIRRAALLVAVAIPACLAAAPGAQAGRGQETILEDNRVLIVEGEARQRAALDELKSLGVDVVRTTLIWRRIAPESGSRTRPAGFDPANPAAYPPGVWDGYDNLVRNAKARGIDVLLTPSGRIPEWASRCPTENTYGSCRPDPKQYAAFVTALARRYSGTYRDERGQVLPAVRRWSIWNEPNLGVWLWPQTERVRGRTIQLGARLYRELFHAATAALRANGHRRSQILLGETAPIGGSKRTPPVDFYTRLFCLRPQGSRRADPSVTADPGCRRKRRFDATGVAHHPYTKGAGRPLLSRQPKGSLTIGQLKSFEALLRRGAGARMIRRKAPIYLTEFGVSSNPPDPKYGVPLTRQSEYLNHADYLAYLTPSVRSVAQYEFEDDPGQILTNTFQTGLKFMDGRPKPAYEAYRLPLYVARAGRRSVRVFGWARAGGRRERIEIQHRRAANGEFATVKTATADRNGFVLAKINRSGGAWRLRWVPSGGGRAFFSRVSGPGPVPAMPAAAVPRYQVAIDYERRTGFDPLLGEGGGTVTAAPGEAACDGPCTLDFAQGTTVELTATPDGSSRFEGWGGACAGQFSETCRIPLWRPHFVTAIFRRTP